MATVQPPTVPVATPAPITSAQPGGGFCMSLELSWGRLRKAFLRRCRPDYVQEMLAKRQGDCPGCPHDIIDPRDLKFYRNVCGYWFRPEDDPFHFRGQLGLARMGLAEVVVASVLFGEVFLVLMVLAVAVHEALLLLLLPPAVVYGLVLYFFRDPERPVPVDPQALVSPADGTITDIGEVAEPEFPGGRAFRIGMFLSIFNVHVNRVPCGGRVKQVRYYPGEFLDARHGECGVRNEQLWIDLEDGRTGQPLRVKQIAGAVARRIVCWLKPGDEVQAGERLGMIKFGSRTEVYLPAGTPVEVLVKVGDAVQGGSSTLLRWKSGPGAV